jgi:hypothetical protein
LGTVPVGLPYPNWTEIDGGVCKGVITNNPQLSPNKTTQIFTLNSMPPRVFWIWYTTANQAIMFAEVPQACNVELILTDYFDYDPAPPPFDPALFVIPPDCLSAPTKSKAVKKSTKAKALGKKTAGKKGRATGSMKKIKKTALGKMMKKAATTRQVKIAKSKPSKPAKKSSAGKKSVVRKPVKKAASKATRKSRNSKKK